jgi:hypothetical protein
MEQDIVNENLKKVSTWKRIFFLLVFAVIMGIVRMLLWAVIALQIGSSLITGEPNQYILGFGRKLSAYLYHILLFLTYCTEKLPFPFSSWDLIDDKNFPDIKE